MVVRNKLRERRKRFKYTQQQMEELTGIDRVRYTKIETGRVARVALNDAYLIAKVLKTTVEELFKEELSEPTKAS